MPFDPNNPRYALGGEMKPGRHLVAIKGFERRNGPQADYVRAEVIGVSPPVRGGRLWSNFSFSEQALWRFGNLANAIGVNKPGEPWADNRYLKLYCGRPFKVQIVDKDGYPDIGRFYPWDEDDPMESDMEGWAPPDGTGKIAYAEGFSPTMGKFQDPRGEHEPERQFEAEPDSGEPPPPGDDDYGF